MAMSHAGAYYPSEQPRLSYKLAFYIGGVAFAVAAYVLVMWAYRLEADSWRNATSQLTFHDVIVGVLPVHLFTFVAWCVVFTAVSILLGYLFDREVRFRKKAEEKANIDGLTELYNHRYFQDRLYTEIERARRYERPLSLVILDIDDFKAFNDKQGHQEGDRLLSWFAKTCVQQVREIDICARYGGEEFAIILPETELPEAIEVAERVRVALGEGSKTVFPAAVTISSGVASFPDHGPTRHALILAADVALFYAKHSGKNRVCPYQPSLTKVYRATPERLQGLLSDEDIGAIEALSNAVDSKDQTTHGHSGAVSRYAMEMGEKLNLPAQELESLHAAALLHDIGKLGMPERILRKKGPLQIEEWQYVENHPKIGSQILEKVQQLGSIVPTVRHHHERFDGHGYPAGLSGKDIPLLSRIIAIADSFDAMISDRNYRKAISPEQALEEIKRCSGTQFDPDLVEIFVKQVEAQLAAQKEESADEDAAA